MLTVEDGELFEKMVTSIEDEYIREVLIRRFGYGEFTPHTLQAVADHFERSRERMRQRVAKQLCRFRRDNQLYPLAMRLYDVGLQEGDHMKLVEQGADPAVVAALQQEAFHTNFARNNGRRFLLDCEGECSSVRPCLSCQARVKLEAAGLLEEIEQLARKYYGEAHNVHELPVQVLELSVRPRNALRNDNIRTLGELCDKTSAELLRAPNMGRKSLNEMIEALARFGLHLRGYNDA